MPGTSSMTEDEMREAWFNGEPIPGVKPATNEETAAALAAVATDVESMLKRIGVEGVPKAVQDINADIVLALRKHLTRTEKIDTGNEFGRGYLRGRKVALSEVEAILDGLA